MLGKLTLEAIGGTGIGHFAVRSVLNAGLASMAVGIVVLIGFVATLWVIRAPEFKLVRGLLDPIFGRLRGMLKR